DSALKEAQAMAQVAARKQREIQTRLSAISGAAKNPAIAKAEGIDIRDPNAVNQRIQELRQMKAAWDNWSTNPDLIGEIRQARGVEAPSLTLRGETEEEIRAREEAAAAEERRRRAEEDAARQAEQEAAERARAEQTVGLFELGQTADQQLSGMGDLFAPPSQKPAVAKEKPAELKGAEPTYVIENLDGERLTYPEVVEWYRRAYKNMEDARTAYRRGELNDDQFLEVKQEFDAIKEEVDAIEQSRGKKAKAPKAEKPVSPKEPAEIRQARREMEQGVKMTPAVLRRRKALIEWEKSQEPAPAIVPEFTAENVVNGEKPPADLPADQRLIFMPCSAKKGGKAGPAADLYQGVFFQTYRSNVTAAPHMVILSAEHGFISPTEEIAPYDRLLDKERADEMLGDMGKLIGQLKEAMAGIPMDQIKDVLLVGGKEYQGVMRAALASLKDDGLIPEDASVNATSGGIGEQRQQLGQYLRAIPGGEEKAAAPAEAPAAEKPVAPAEKPAKAPKVAKEKPPYTPEQRKEAEGHAEEIKGDLFWQKGDYALVRTYSLTGDTIYIPTMGSRRAMGVDVRSFTNKALPEDIKQEMLAAREQAEREAEIRHEFAPFIKFKDGIALSEDIPDNLAGVIRGWKDLLKLDAPIYVSTIEDARRNKNNFTGPHRRIGSGTINENDAGSMRRMKDGSYYILFTKSTSPTVMLEILGHELGHLHQALVFDRAPRETQQAIKDAHKKWLASQKGKTAKELVASMRGRATARRVRYASEDLKAEEASSYWHSFKEWYADQVSRWAVSSEAPVTVVEKFFKRLGNQLRQFYQQLKNKKYLPDETFAKYINEVTARAPELTPPKDVSDAAEQSQAMVERGEGLSGQPKDVATWSAKRIEALLNEFQYFQKGRENDTKAYAAFIDPLEFVYATTTPGNLRDELLSGKGQLDIERMANERQTPFLEVEKDANNVWRIVGHEGRHRMAALAANGVKSVPIVIRMVGEAQAYPSIDAKTLAGQRFATGKGDVVQVSNLVPLSYAYQGDVMATFGSEGTLAFNIEPVEPAVAKPSRSRLGLYSALLEGINSVPTTSAPAASWKSVIKGLVNKGQAKADEVEWSGVNDWLDLQQGKVTKEQVARYLKAGGVQVEETVLGESKPREDDTDFDTGRYEGFDESKYGSPTLTLPGGENYREVLLTLPERSKKETWEWYDPDTGESEQGFATQQEAYDARPNIGAVVSKVEAKDSPQNYRSHHWDQPNVIAHIRVNDRIDADGNKVLFVEELQSDWAQQGRKSGFALSGNALELERQRLRDEHNAFVQEQSNALNDELRDVKARLRNLSPEQNDQGAILRAREENIYGLLRILSELEPGEPLSSGIPAAPFVTKTEGWLNLALKRIMVMAAEGGYDKVAFVNGEQSAGRYDLSQQVVSIEWDTAGKERSISLNMVNGNDWQLDVNADGVVIDGPTELVNKPLDAVLGKDIASKIMGGQGGVLSGVDLKVGGEGMKAFYDQIVPAAIKKLLPKVGGGQMEAVRIADATDKGNFAAEAVEYDDGDALFNDKISAAEFIKRNPDIIEKSGMDQPGFTVTDAMREKVAEGVPMFNVEPTELTEEKKQDYLDEINARIREEDIAEYKSLRQRLAAIPRKVAEGRVGP
ncbi:MAG: hypothetical protein EBR82_44100, partial [Caulobacteraceae bacterium]|nr:hypothetical protein [Caulobacteraceae bacterium]